MLLARMTMWPCESAIPQLPMNLLEESRVTSMDDGGQGWEGGGRGEENDEFALGQLHAIGCTSNRLQNS